MSAGGPVWLLTDAAMDRHHAPGHPERPARRTAVADAVRQVAGVRLVEVACREATRDELERVHDTAYLDLLDELDRRGGAWLDADTFLVAGSVHAARLAAGATIQAAAAVTKGEAEVAVAAVRPPGHHAASARGSGFCLLNNVALAVEGLRAAGLASRIAIVDWDAHHGDGTQAIFDDDADLLYASTHQAPFYPGTGRPENRGIGPAMGTKHNVPLSPGAGDDAFVSAWTESLLPALEAFAPQAILVSAGFDAHRDDPLANLEVTDDGYGRVARALGECSGRLDLPGVAITLEGGYDLVALRDSIVATVHGIIDGRSGAS